mgnify:CR=1 FL=1
MKITASVFKKLALVTFGLFAIYSCSDDSEISEDVTLSQVELKTILETDDVSGAVDTVLSDLYINNSSSGKSAKNNDCYSAEYSDTGYTVTFNNCVLNGSDNVNGTLVVTYNLENDTASYTATYEDFYVGEIKINGTRTYVLSGNSDENSVSFTVTSDMTLVLEDGEMVSENGIKTFAITFGDSLETTTFSIDGNWTLVADGNTYKVNVTSALLGNLSCGYLTNGSMTIDKNGLSIGVNFGDGTCDDKAMVTYPNGVEEEITLTK